jgi:hypothetical protein
MSSGRERERKKENNSVDSTLIMSLKKDICNFKAHWMEQEFAPIAGLWTPRMSTGFLLNSG